MACRRAISVSWSGLNTRDNSASLILRPAEPGQPILIPAAYLRPYRMTALGGFLPFAETRLGDKVASKADTASRGAAWLTLVETGFSIRS